jgi:hypothetical protein
MQGLGQAWRAPPLLGAIEKKRPQCVNNVPYADTTPSLSTAKGKIGIAVVDLNIRQRPPQHFIPLQELFDPS